MAAKIAQVLTGETNPFYGKTLKVGSGQTTIEPGMLVKLETSGSSVATAGSAAANRPFGMAFGHRYSPYTPTTKIFAAGEKLTVAKGYFLAALSVDFFDEGVLPSTVGQALYCANNGKWTVNVTANQVGRYIRQDYMFEPVSGLGTQLNVAIVEANLVS